MRWFFWRRSFWRWFLWSWFLWCRSFWCWFIYIRIFFFASGIICVIGKSTVVCANLILEVFSTYIPCRWLYDLEVNDSKLVERSDGNVGYPKSYEENCRALPTSWRSSKLTFDHYSATYKDNKSHE